MTALRQQRIRQERERARFIEEIHKQYMDRIEDLLLSNRDHMIKIARLERELIERGQEIQRLTEALQTSRSKYQSGINELLPIIARLNDDFQ